MVACGYLLSNILIQILPAKRKNIHILPDDAGAGTTKPNRHVRYAPNTPMSNLFLSMLDRMGVPADTLGDSTGRLAQLF